MTKVSPSFAAVDRRDGSHRLAGSWPGVDVANGFLAHLESRAFSPATVRAYAFDLVNFARFLDARRVDVGGVVPTDIFDWIDWQSVRRPSGRGPVVANRFGPRVGAGVGEPAGGRGPSLL